MFQSQQFPPASPATGAEQARDIGPERLIDIFFYGLYQDPGILAEHQVQPRHVRRARLHDYFPEAVLLHCEDGSTLTALCYITRQAAPASQQNPEYARKLTQVMQAWQLETDHIH